MCRARERVRQALVERQPAAAQLRHTNMTSCVCSLGLGTRCKPLHHLMMCIDSHRNRLCATIMTDRRGIPLRHVHSHMLIYIHIFTEDGSHTIFQQCALIRPFTPTSISLPPLHTYDNTPFSRNFGICSLLLYSQICPRVALKTVEVLVPWGHAPG